MIKYIRIRIYILLVKNIHRQIDNLQYNFCISQDSKPKFKTLYEEEDHNWEGLVVPTERVEQ